MSTRRRTPSSRARPTSALSFRDAGSSPIVRRSADELQVRTKTLSRPTTSDYTRKSFSETDRLESEYIKNLQQQIYFLELEVNYLREQAKAKESIPSKPVADENSQNSQEIDSLKLQLHNYQDELSQRTATADRVTAEKQQLLRELELRNESFRREKQALVEEIVSLKKRADSHNREVTRRATDTRKLKEVSTKSYAALVEAETKQKILRDQLEHRTESMKELRLELERRKADELRLQTHVQELEHRFLGSDAAKKDDEIRDLQDEMRKLRLQLKQSEVDADQDRYMKNKITDDCSALVKENALLTSQVAELRTQIERERSHRSEREERRTTSIKELAELRHLNKEKTRELERLQSAFRHDQGKLKETLVRLADQEKVTSETQSTAASLSEELRDLERIHRKQDQENIALRRDKVLLADHVADIQEKIELKDEEIRRLNAELSQMRGRVVEMTSRARLQKSLEALKWDEFEKMADTIKTVSTHGRELASSLSKDSSSTTT
ncbi:calponin homology domain-containing protein DDB_G0272472-like isoform X2 [Oscarella lobularis]|uniref:calponin homology domain-containing protein DDB_G0272472-like isoform X2 n=1 Tax=Oscarella lobularis TaxID=121494 RepID=UPI003313F06C